MITLSNLATQASSGNYRYPYCGFIYYYRSPADLALTCSITLYFLPLLRMYSVCTSVEWSKEGLAAGLPGNFGFGAPREPFNFAQSKLPTLMLLCELRRHVALHAANACMPRESVDASAICMRPSMRGCEGWESGRASSALPPFLCSSGGVGPG